MKHNDHENEKSGSARSLWSRLLNGAELTTDEQTVLREALGSDERLRKECDSDATVHALLLSMNDVRQTEDDFVRGVMGAVEKGTTRTEVLEKAAAKTTSQGGIGRGQRRRLSLGWLSLA